MHDMRVGVCHLDVVRYVMRYCTERLSQASRYVMGAVICYTQVPHWYSYVLHLDTSLA